MLNLPGDLKRNETGSKLERVYILRQNGHVGNDSYYFSIYNELSSLPGTYTPDVTDFQNKSVNKASASQTQRCLWITGWSCYNAYPTAGGLERAWDSAFLTRTPGMPMPLVPGPYFEQQEVLCFSTTEFSWYAGQHALHLACGNEANPWIRALWFQISPSKLRKDGVGDGSCSRCRNENNSGWGLEGRQGPGWRTLGECYHSLAIMEGVVGADWLVVRVGFRWSLCIPCS